MEPIETYRNRWERVSQMLEDKGKGKGYEAYIAQAPGNLRYLCCSHIASAPIVTYVIIPKMRGRGECEPIAITSSLEEFRVREECPIKSLKVFCGYPAVPSDGKNGIKLLRKVLKGLGINISSVLADEKIAGMRCKIDNIVGKMRMEKDKDEIRKIREAVKISDYGAKLLETEILAEGKTEADVARELDYAMRGRKGAQANAFTTIIASGRHGAFSHHDPSTVKKLEAGDMVICDFGVYYEGYCSDITRTYPMGNVSEKLLEIYDIVHESSDAAIKAVKQGESYKKIDKVARDVIIEYGYGRNFVHSTGHGLGLEVHELPAGIRPETKEVIGLGNVFTIEPGIYLPGTGGIRIEDDLYVSQTGNVEVLTKAKK